MNIWQRSTALQIVKIVFLTVVLLFVSYSLILRVPAAHKIVTVNSAKIEPQAVNSSALYRGNAQRTGAFDEPAIRQMSGIRWTKPFGSVVHESPVYADGVLYLGSDAGRVTAIDAASGETIWSAKAKGSSVFSPVAVADGIVYIGTEKNRIYAFDARSGEQIWQFKTKGIVWTAPLVVNGMVYFASDDGTFYALTKDRELVWKVNIGETAIAPPAYDNGVVFLAAGTLLLAVDSQTGQQRWRLEGGGRQEWYAPVITDGKLFAGNGDGYFYALNAQTGETLWRYQAGGDAWSAPAVSNGVVYIGNKDTNFYALNAGTGEWLWRYKTEDAATSDPIYADGVVYFGVGNHEFPPREGPRHLYALDAQSGQELWTFQAESRILGGLAMGNGVIYFATFSGKIYAIN